MVSAPVIDSGQAVVVQRHDRIMLIVINRPEARNAVNAEVCIRVGDALEEADHDPEVAVVVITGAGDKAFSAGADLKALAAGVPVIPEGREHWGLAGFVRHPIDKPTIAAVNGAALGGGCEIALAADLIVAAEHAVFGLPEAGRGLIAAAGGAFRLGRRVPRAVAMELLLTGEPIDARTALAVHLVNRVVPADQLLDTAMELAGRIAANAPLAVQAHKRLLLRQTRTGQLPDEEDDWAATAREAAVIMASEDGKEGPRAFAEKRRPVWTGR